MPRKREIPLPLFRVAVILCGTLFPFEQFLMTVQHRGADKSALAGWLIGVVFAMGVVLLPRVSPAAALPGFLFCPRRSLLAARAGLPEGNGFLEGSSKPAERGGATT